MLAPWLLCLVPFATDDPVISEFMAANDHTLSDEDGDYPDWLELHNPAASDLDLSGWYLTDDAGELDRWRLPTVTTVPAGSFLVVFASGKDRSGPELHTDFKLKAEGEYLALVAPDGSTVVHEYAPEYPTQLDDVSYGLAFDAGGVSDTETWFPEPTPGAANGAGGPAILEVLHQPERPTRDDVITVSAHVLPVPGSSLTEVSMSWRPMFDQDRLETMHDDGLGGDAQAGDGVYTAQIPPRQVKRGRMIRWFVRALDVSGATGRSPPYPDPVNSPEYHGTILDDPRFADSHLPILHWFAEDHNGADSRAGTRGAAFHDGLFYDNVFVRTRGGSSSGWRKHSYKIEFNRGHDLVWSAPEWGVGERRTDEINLNTTWSDKAFVRQSLAFDVMRDVGVAGSAAFPVRMQRNGQFWSVAIWIEQVDGDGLQRNGLDSEGALYKMYNQTTDAYAGVEKKTRLHEDHSDLERLVRKVNRQDENVVEKYLFDEVDLPAMLNYLAATALIHETDHVHKNHYLWRDTEGDGEWRFLPWDKDLSFGRNYIPGQGVLNDTIYADDDPWSHPLLGDRDHANPDGPIVVPHTRFDESRMRRESVLLSDVSPSAARKVALAVAAASSTAPGSSRKSSNSARQVRNKRSSVNGRSTSEVTRSSSPTRTGRTTRSSSSISSCHSIRRSRTLSTATWVDATSRTRLPLARVWAMSSQIAVVFPDPGGPSKNAKSGVPSAMDTKRRCSVVPSRSRPSSERRNAQ